MPHERANEAAIGSRGRTVTSIVTPSATPAQASDIAATLPTLKAESQSFGWLLASIGVGLLVWLLPFPWGAEIQLVLAISAFMVVSWISHAMDHAITGFVGCFAFWATGAATFPVAFAGFAETTPWFLFGALMIGAMAATSGLARRMAYTVMRTVGHSYSRLLIGLILSDFLLTFLVPSGIARVVIMGSVALGLCHAFGATRGSNIGRGMFIIITYTATIFDKMIIAGAASITARGIIERSGGVEVLWAHWFLAFLPADLITIFVAWRLTMRFYPPETRDLPDGKRFLNDALRSMGPWTSAEIRAAALMGCAITLWMTDAFHHISPPMVGMGIGLLATMPGVGVLRPDDLKRVNYLPIFFVATAIGMGHVLVESKSLNILTDAMFGWMTPFVQNRFSATAVLYWTSFLYHIPLGDEVVMLATSLPVLMNFAHLQKLDPLLVGMIWTFGAGGKLFVYQSAPLVVGYAFGFFSGRDMFKIGAVLTLVEFLVLLLVLTPFLWPMMGL
jgi:solute carrier family 13 (sodium-dependent dicarboxylate transporter), member 2/3/5